MNRSRTSKPARVRCAVYCRKSSEEGLESEFNSLDAQRDSGEAYVASQKAEGWVCLPDRYDDGGFSGGNMDRPALKRLLADIEAGKVARRGSPTCRSMSPRRSAGRGNCGRGWLGPDGSGWSRPTWRRRSGGSTRSGGS